MGILLLRISQQNDYRSRRDTMRFWEVVKMVDEDPSLEFKASIKKSTPFGAQTSTLHLVSTYAKTLKLKEGPWPLEVTSEIMEAEWELIGE